MLNNVKVQNYLILNIFKFMYKINNIHHLTCCRIFY